MTESGEGDERPRSLLADCIEEPAAARRRLPAVLGRLEADDELTRLAAAWTCCLAVVADPDLAEYVVDRLADRFDSEDRSRELSHALAFLADRHPAVVESVLEEHEEEAPVGSPPWGAPRTPGPNGPVHDIDGPSRSGVGRVRYPDPGEGDDPRRTYPRGRPDERELAENRDGDPGEGRTSESDDPGEPGSPDADTLARPTSDISGIAARSRFDQLHVLAAQDRSRFGEDYRALVGTEGEERAVTLRLLSVPEGIDDRSQFEAALEACLGRWADVPAHPHVVSLLDWDTDPRPWLATTYAGQSLAARGRLDVADALADAIALADALAHVHRTDVVHAGIDPGTVVYPGDVLDGNDQEPPLLDGVGLVGLLRHYENPARLLDPRYAAPEYFDRRFGAVDAATDVYGLGAITFHLFAGRPPVDGSFGEVRDAVTSPATPVPGDVAADVPGAVDDVVEKALATQKLTRYESVDHLQQDLHAIREAHGR